MAQDPSVFLLSVHGQLEYAEVGLVSDLWEHGRLHLCDCARKKLTDVCMSCFQAPDFNSLYCKYQIVHGSDWVVTSVRTR